MMFETYVGALRDDSAVQAPYLRPGDGPGHVHVDFKSVVDTGRVKLPFGIAQIGKSFRNEITPRNFIFRSREFEQMEMEYFLHEDADWAASHREWINWCTDWPCASIGLPDSHLSEVQPSEGEAGLLLQGHDRHHVQVPLRGAGALGRGRPRQLRPDPARHRLRSVPQVIFDEATKKKFTPHVIEPARSESTGSSSPSSAPATRKRT